MVVESPFGKYESRYERRKHIKFEDSSFKPAEFSPTYAEFEEVLDSLGLARLKLILIYRNQIALEELLFERDLDCDDD